MKCIDFIGLSIDLSHSTVTIQQKKLSEHFDKIDEIIDNPSLYSPRALAQINGMINSSCKAFPDAQLASKSWAHVLQLSLKRARDFKTGQIDWDLPVVHPLEAADAIACYTWWQQLVSEPTDISTFFPCPSVVCLTDDCRLPCCLNCSIFSDMRVPSCVTR